MWQILCLGMLVLGFPRFCVPETNGSDGARAGAGVSKVVKLWRETCDRGCIAGNESAPGPFSSNDDVLISW